MQCIIKRRANTPEKKALRLQQIMSATATRFSTLSYDQVNLNHIAADVGITKAALYRYFRNKETLFLALYTQQMQQLIITAEAEMQSIPLTAAICNALVQHPLFCKLSAIMHTALESNLTIEEARIFKTTLLQFIQQYAQMLHQHYGLSLTGASQLVLQVQQVIIGCWHMSTPSAAVAEVVKTSELQLFDLDFEAILRAHIQRLVHTYI